ncbi:MAG: recombinase family protein [Desulfomonilaceae bacterium]
MKAIGYARVSSQEQVDGTSLKSQEDQIRAYAAMKGIELLSVLVDAGISGGKPLALRPEGSKLTEMIRAGEVQAIIISKLDRGFRSASDCLFNIEAWEKKGISLHILNLGGTTIDTSTPTGKFFLTIMAGAAELERNLIRERCNEGRKIRRAEGRRIGEIPYGWQLVDDGKSLIESPEEQRALSLVHSMKNSGHTLRAIAAELNRRGYTAKKGGEWTHGQVQSILRRVA